MSSKAVLAVINSTANSILKWISENGDSTPHNEKLNVDDIVPFSVY